MILKIKGDGSYLGFVDLATYKGFVGPDWANNPRLLEPHFIEQMKNYRGLFWNTNLESNWNVDIRKNITLDKGFREVLGSIEITAGKLALFEYNALTMMAQFENYTIESQLTDNFIEVENGKYKVRVVQLNNPTVTFPNADSVDFLIELEKLSDLLPAWIEVPWSML